MVATKKTVDIIDENSEAAKDALSLLALGMIGWLSNFVSGLVADDAFYSTIANIVTILSFMAAVIRTGFIFMEWREKRKMIEIKRRVAEEEAREEAKRKARESRIEKNMEDILYAPTADEIHEILARNARDKGDE